MASKKDNAGLSFKKPLHHAYVIEGEIARSKEAVRSFLTEELGISLQGNIDLLERDYDGFGIDDAREIKDLMLEKPIGEYKIFLISTPSMTSQSGNALLKALEEPPKGTHFFILVPNSKRLLDTLMSRVMLLKMDERAEIDTETIGISADEFLRSNKVKKMENIKEILSLYDKERISKAEIISFFKKVLEGYRSKKKFDTDALAKAVAAFDYMSDQSSSLKILMEFIALTLD